MELQCAKCGTYFPSGRIPGSVCGLPVTTTRTCNGNLLPVRMLQRRVAPSHHLDLACDTCGSVSSSGVTGRQVGQACPIPNCGGRLDRYWG